MPQTKVINDINYINLEDYFWCEVDGVRYFILPDGHVIKYKK